MQDRTRFNHYTTFGTEGNHQTVNEDNLLINEDKPGDTTTIPNHAEARRQGQVLLPVQNFESDDE